MSHEILDILGYLDLDSRLDECLLCSFNSSTPHQRKQFEVYEIDIK